MADYALCGGKTNSTRSKRKKKSLLVTYKAITLSNQPKQYNISSDRLIRIWVKKWKTSGDKSPTTPIDKDTHQYKILAHH